MTVAFLGNFSITGFSYTSLTVGSLFVPSLLLGLLSVHSFLVCGGRLINASSVISLGVLIFGGFAGIYTSWGLNDVRAAAVVEQTLLGLTLIFFFQLLIVAPWIFGKPATLAAKQEPLLPLRLFVPRLLMGTILLGVATLDAVLGGRVLFAPVGLVGILVWVDTCFHLRSRRVAVAVAVAAAAFSWIYYEFVFQGFGRLVLGVLFCAIAILFSIHNQRVHIKLAVLAAVALGLPVLARQRLAFLAEYRGSAPLESEGWGSVAGPLVSFARLIQASQDGKIPPALGETFADALTLWIPRVLWPEKPVGFGISMVRITQPHLPSSTTFSDASLFSGELIWNFGVIGTIATIPLVALLVRRIDRSFLSTKIVGPDFAESILRIMVVVLAASLLHFFWGGSYTYIARTFVMLVSISMLYVYAHTRELKVQTVRVASGSTAANQTPRARVIRSWGP